MSLPTEPAFYIAAFAAIISTIALIWNIINAIMSRKAKLRIDLTVVQQMVVDPVHGLGNPVPYFDITITNVGASTRSIKTPTFLFDQAKQGIAEQAKRFKVIDMVTPVMYPLELKVGQQFNYKVDILEFVQHFKGQLDKREKVRIEAQDTHNKRYRSRKISLEAVTNAMEVATKMQK